MSQTLQVAFRSPLSEVFQQIGDYAWVNPNSGVHIQWDFESQCYVRWDPWTQQWSWWGSDRRGVWSWHSYLREPSRLWGAVKLLAAAFVIGNAVEYARHH